MNYIKIGNRRFALDGSCRIMGILNVTPDSFSDGGRFNSVEAAALRAREMVAEGADIIDVGGESTRPGHTRISDEEEIARVVPVIERIKAELDVPVSVDTYKSAVAGAAVKAGADLINDAVKAGADLINDIWGFRYDEGLARLTAEAGLPCVLMDNRTEPVTGDIIEAMKATLAESIEIARRAGVADENIILDPGIGFGKTYEQNLTAINRLDELCGLGFPVLLAASRKSVIGNTLNLPAGERVEGTVATSVIGVMKGAAFVRVHDVKENLRAVKMTEAILKERSV